MASSKFSSKVGTLLMLLCSCCYMASCSLQEITVVPSSAADSPYLYTISKFCQDHNLISNTVITILGGIHMLNTTCNFQNASNITVKAQVSSPEVIIQCENSGFKFLNMSHLKISDIEFRGCGVTWHLQTQYSSYVASNISALVFVNGSNLDLRNVKAISNGIFIHNVAGIVTVDSSEVTQAVLTSLISLYDNPAVDANFRLTNSMITNNGGKDQFFPPIALLLGTPKLSFYIESTMFSNNFGSLGGNLVIVFQDLSFVTISNATFSNGQEGGGLYVGISNDKFRKSEMQFSNFLKLLNIIDSSFVGNVATNVAGGVNVQWAENSLFNESLQIDITNTTFKHNYANQYSQRQGGVALHFQANANGQNTQEYYYKSHLNVSVSNCTFINNSGYYFLDTTSTITAYRVPSLRLNGIVVESNKCSGLLAVDSNMVLSGRSVFANNSAMVGGGLQLFNAQMILMPDTDLIISNNTAQKTGGGIHIHEPPGCATLEDCFYQYSSQDSINFVVSNNQALNGGDNLFGSIYSCDTIAISIPLNTRISSSVSSKPLGMSFDGTRCSKGKCVKSMMLYPGQRVAFTVLLFGGDGKFFIADGLVSGSVSATVNGATIKEIEEIQRVHLSRSVVTYTVYSSNSNRGNIVIQPTEQACIQFYTNPHVEIEVIFSDCPLGFNFTKVSRDRFICECDSRLPIISNCSIETQTISKRKDSWLGKYEQNSRIYLATSDYCPFDYCISTFNDIKSDNKTLYQDEQCQYNRTGILCGSCQEGWSLVLGSSKCHEDCSNVWLLLILPFALAGLLLVALIHFLNLTVTMGTMSGLIFYANIIQNYSVVVLSKHPIAGLTPILYIFLSWLNLDLGISTCFYHGMEAFGKTMLQFVFPVYIWLTSATIIVLNNRYIFFTRLVGENAVQVLSTLFLLSYSKVLHTAIDSINLKSIDIYVNYSTISEMRWAVDGNVSYFDLQKHLALFVIALLTILLLLPFSLTLLCIKYVYSFSNCSKVFSCIDKLKPFFDSFTGPFKDRARFWTGLLLFVRLLLILVSSLDYSDGVIPYYIIVAACFFLSAVMIFLHGVYKKKCLNILEYFFILNVGIIFLVNSYEGGSDLWKSLFTHILVSLAFLAFLGIIAYHVYLKLVPLYRRRFLYRLHNADSDMDRQL